jgi:adenylosuccinate lyase
MEQEEAMLDSTLRGLREVRSALAQGTVDGLTGVLEHQAKAARAAEELWHRRAQMRLEIASCCGTDPQSATLQMLARRVPGELADRLNSCRSRLKRMAGEIERLNRGNAALVRQSLAFLERLFAGLTGTEAASHTYGPSGQQRSLVCGSIIEGQG